MNGIQKKSSIYVTITNNTANFKTRIPWEWCEELGLNEKDKEICLTYKENGIVIEKKDIKLFTNLKKMDKVLQVKKFIKIHQYEYENIKDLVFAIEQHFKITYRTVYRYIKEEVSEEDIDNTELLPVQDENIRKTNMILVSYKNLKTSTETITSTLTIPTNLAILFLQGKDYNQLGIKTAIEIYNSNVNIPIILEKKENKIIIKEVMQEIVEQDEEKEYAARIY